MAQYPAALPSIETTTSGQLMSAVGHSDLHDQVADEVTAIATTAGVNPHQPASTSSAAPFASVKARLDAECILRCTSGTLPGAGTNVDRFTWQTDLRRLSIGTASGHETVWAPDVHKVSTTGRVGINNTSPGLTFHVHTVGSTSQPTVIGTEVARFVNTVAASNECVVSVIGGTTGGAKVVLGDSGTLNRAGVELDATTGELGLSVAGTRKAIIATDGAASFRRDGSGSFPTLGSAVGLAVIRNHTAGANCSLATIADTTGNAQHIFGTSGNQTRGIIAYNNSTDSFRFNVNQLSDPSLEIKSNGVSHFIRGAPGTQPAVSTGEVARFVQNTTTADIAAVAIIGGEGSGSAELRFGTANSATNLAKIVHDSTSKDLIFNTDNAETLRLTAAGRLHIRRAGGGTSPSFTTDESFRVQNNVNSTDSCALSLIAGASGNNNIFFGSGASSNTLGVITYLQSLQEMRFRCNNVLGLKLTADGANGPDVYMQGVYDHTSASAANVFVGTDGHLVRSTSTQESKRNIRPLPLTDAVKLLTGSRPVTFQSRSPVDGDTEFVGFIAEEVAAADPRAAQWNGDGQVDNYDLRSIVAALTAVVLDRVIPAA